MHPNLNEQDSQTANTLAFIEVIKLTDDQSIKPIWLLGPGYGGNNTVLSFPQDCIVSYEGFILLCGAGVLARVSSTEAYIATVC